MGDLGKLIVAKGFEKLPKVQQIAQSGHTDLCLHSCVYLICHILQIIWDFLERENLLKWFQSWAVNAYNPLKDILNCTGGGEDLVRKSHKDIKMDGAKLAEGWFTQQILD